VLFTGLEVGRYSTVRRPICDTGGTSLVASNLYRHLFSVKHHTGVSAYRRAKMDHTACKRAVTRLRNRLLVELIYARTRSWGKAHSAFPDSIAGSGEKKDPGDRERTQNENRKGCRYGEGREEEG